MKEIWVLSVITSLPEICEDFSKMKCELHAFESFEKAREVFRAKIKDLAFSQNAMFDGNGKLTQFEEYADELNDLCDDDFCDAEEKMLSKNVYTQILGALTAAFGGMDTKLTIENGFYTDLIIAVDVEDNSVSFHADYNDPLCAYDPTLKTNIFSMEKESDYYLYVNDQLSQGADTAELYIDLKKITVK